MVPTVEMAASCVARTELGSFLLVRLEGLLYHDHASNTEISHSSYVCPILPYLLNYLIIKSMLEDYYVSSLWKQMNEIKGRS